MRFITVKHYCGIDYNEVRELIINIDLITSIEKDERFYRIYISGTTGLNIDRQDYDRICDIIGVSL